MDNFDATHLLDDAQHERFCQLIAEGKTSQGQAYLDAGYQCSSLDIASAAATRLLKNVKVSVRIQTLKEQAARLATLDASYILSGLMMNAEDARAKKDYVSSNRAFELLGKSLNLFKDGVVPEDKTTYELPDFSKMTPDEIREARAELMRKAN